MWALVALAMVFSPASAIKLTKEQKDAVYKTALKLKKDHHQKAEIKEVEPSEKDFLPNYAYVTTWMKQDQLPKHAKFAEVMPEAEEKEYLNSEEFKASHPKRRIELMATNKTEMESDQADGWDIWHRGYSAKTIFKLDDQLRATGSKYPYVIVTNDPELYNHPNLTNHPYMHILKVGDGPEHDVSLVHLRAKVMLRNMMHVQKLSIFSLTQYKKLISLDMDISIHDPIDHIFDDFDTEDGKRIWGILNNFECTGSSRRWKAKQSEGHGDYFNSAVMLLEPKKEVYDGLYEFTRNGGGFYGDQMIVQKYFQKYQMSPKLMSPDIADFSQCHGGKMDPKTHKRRPEIAHHR